MKKAICIILTAVMFLLVSCDTTITTSIPTQTPNTTETTETTTMPEPTVDLKSIKYTINVGSKPSMIIKSEDALLDHNGNKITVSTEDIGSASWFRYVANHYPDAPEKKTFEFNGKEYELNYVDTFLHYLVENEKLYVQHFEFSDDIVQIKAEFVEKKIIAFSYTLKNNKEKGNFTVEDAKIKAEEYLNSLYYYGSNIDKYVLSNVSKKNGNISLTYDRSDTGEILFIDFDSMGRIIKFDTKSNKIFEPQDVVLLEEKIENARKAVKESLLDKYELEESETDSFLFHPDTGKIIVRLYVYAKKLPAGHDRPMNIYPVYINID